MVIFLFSNHTYKAFVDGENDLALEFFHGLSDSKKENCRILVADFDNKAFVQTELFDIPIGTEVFDRDNRVFGTITKRYAPNDSGVRYQITDKKGHHTNTYHNMIELLDMSERYPVSLQKCRSCGMCSRVTHTPTYQPLPLSEQYYQCLAGVEGICGEQED